MALHLNSGTAKRKKGILTFMPYSDLAAGRDEAEEQRYLFEWIRAQESMKPTYARIYHVPNGGKRSKGVAGQLKAEGVRSGVPDICYPVARGGYHGLYIELKVGKNSPTAEQQIWLGSLEKEGYLACVCNGWGMAAEVISAYHDGMLKKSEVSA